jgi:hypothetical protein
MRRTLRAVAFALLGALAQGAVGPGGGPAPPAAAQQPDYLSWAAPGPYRSPDYADFAPGSFRSDQPLVAAYFFYWFDAAYLRSRTPVERFPYTPVDEDTQSFLDPGWYYKQFGDMLDAGIDVVLPDYWGEPGQYDRRVAPAPELNHFATQGLPPMVEALQRLDAEGRPLRVALFLDSHILRGEDLTTERGKQVLYATVRDYFSRIPPRYWAAIDGRPVVWLYDAQGIPAFDQSTFDYLYDRFPADFGGLRPWIVREWQWYAARSPASAAVLRTEGLYGWGAAPFGFNADPRFTVAAVGPGYTTTDPPGPERLETPRRDGAYYAENLQQALASGRRILAVETWNELDEGTGILETREFGRQYIDLTRRFADLLKGTRPP